MSEAFVSVKQFIGNEIPNLVNGKQKLKAVFATYNDVDGHDNGPVDTSDGNLSILVQSAQPGGPSFGAMMRVFSGMTGGDYDDAGARAESEAAQQKLEEQSNNILGNIHGDLLVVVYTGLMAFEKASDFVRRLHGPKRTVVVLTCNCGINRKKRALAPLVESGVLKQVIVTPECGGSGVMGELLDSLVSAWPKREAPEQ